MAAKKDREAFLVRPNKLGRTSKFNPWLATVPDSELYIFESLLRARERAFFSGSTRA